MAEDKPKIRGRRSFVYVKGKRKTSSARLRFYKKGNEEFTVNGRPMAEHFTEKNLQKIVTDPIKRSGRKDYEISARVIGGGKHAQAEALRLAVSRAIVAIDENKKKVLKKAGFLTRDPRKKERKKPGLKRARRAPQWSKR